MGFLPHQLVGRPKHSATGFSRQLLLFVKVPTGDRTGGGGCREGQGVVSAQLDALFGTLCDVLHAGL